MNRKILINSILIMSAGLMIPSGFAFAQDLQVDFETTPLFSESNFLPGDTITRWVRVANNSLETQPVATEAINYSGFPNPANVPIDDLSRALDFVIREKGGADLYGGAAGAKILFDFFQEGETYLSEVASGSYKEYEFEIYFPLEKEDEWQGKTTGFDVLIGFQGTGGTGDNGNGEVVTTGGGGGGLPPGLTITQESQAWTNTENCTITINWATNYFSTSQVIYAPEGGSRTLDLEDLNYGYDYSKEGDDSGLEKVTYHAVTLSGLLPDTTYYYRCVSHGSLAVSTEFSFETSCCTGGRDETSFTENTEGQGEAGGDEEGPAFAKATAGEEGDFIPELVEEYDIAGIVGRIRGGDEGGEGPSSADAAEGEEGFFRAMAANIGDVFYQLFGQGQCLPWQLLLVLLIYSILKTTDVKKEKKELCTWAVWGSVLVLIMLCFFSKACPCLTVWHFLLLGGMTFLIRWFFSRESGQE